MGAYSYGFNGKENDNEAKGSGNQYDYGFRIYDPRISRFLSVDPLFKTYPWYTPYQFAGNKPTNAIDIDGLEEWDLSTPANNLKRMESQYKIVLNPLQNVPQAQKNVFVSPTTKAEIQKSIKYTEQAKRMKKLYNSDQGWSFRIFSGVGGGAISFAEDAAVGYTIGKIGQGVKYLKNVSTSTPNPTLVMPELPPISTMSNGSSEASQIFVTSFAKSGLKLENSVAGVMGDTYKSVGEVRVPIKNSGLLEELNAASKGDWVKVYEAGIQNGNKIETHYFLNETTKQVFDVKTKYDYWHQKEFKKL